MKIQLAGLLLGLFLMSFGRLYAQPVAMLTDQQGDVSVNASQLELFAEIASGTEITLLADSQVTLVYIETGKEFTITGPASLSVKTDALYVNGEPVQGQDLMENAGIDLDIGSLTHAAIVIRGKLDVNKSLILVYPFDTHVLSSQPEFSWVGLGEGFTYQFELYGKHNQSLYKTMIQAPRVTLPKSIRLPEDELLTWRVMASKQDTEYLGQGQFTVLPKPLALQVSAKRPKADASKTIKLRYVKYLESLNLKAEAKSYLQEASMAQNHP